MKKTVGRSLPGGAYLEITAEERGDEGTLSPGFSVTADLYEKHGSWSGRAQKRNGREADMFGCLHDEVLRYAPELAPVVAVHLADPDGTPMHALASGWYYYSGEAAAYERHQIAQGRDYGYSRLLEKSDHDRAAQALNIPPADLPEGLTKAEFAEFAESLAERWAADAAAAREALADITDGEGVA